MTRNYDKLKTLLIELFQLDQPDLDFGLYRIMHAKSAEVTQFLDNELLPQVTAAFGQFRSADKAEMERELNKVIAGVEAAGMYPEQSPKVQALREQLKNDGVDVGRLESEVYDHLFSFFRRYYSEGDFLAKRVYKPGVYAIPYEGEEVMLHWANKDQYYIKTSEYLRDYAFRLRPDLEEKPMRVHFRLADVAEGEHGNVKASEGKERRFKLAEENPVTLEDGELMIRFTYQPDTAKQKELNAAAEEAIAAMEDASLKAWITELGKPNVRSDGSSSGTRLRLHLDRYTARNTFDYFIHKNLGGFLRRELDFFIKNEVHAFKVLKLESYEDALNNLEPRRTSHQQLTLDSPEAQGAECLKEQYILRYMLDVETRGSQSLLNVQAFTDPTAYKLKVKRPGSDESCEMNIDLLESFNWLVGLTVRKIAAPQSFSALFERDSEKRLRLHGPLKPEADAPYWFRTVTGTVPDGRKALIIWRKLTGEPEQDNLVLDEWFTLQGYAARESDVALIYVNGGNNLENLKQPGDLWKVRLIEEDFHRLMFEAKEGV